MPYHKKNLVEQQPYWKCGKMIRNVPEVNEKHSKECIAYNEKFFGDKANLGECICEY
jgi:hypothetical protein